MTPVLICVPLSAYQNRKMYFFLPLSFADFVPAGSPCRCVLSLSSLLLHRGDDGFYQEVLPVWHLFSFPFVVDHLTVLLG